MESGELNVGDKVVIIGATTGVLETEVKELRLDLAPISKVVKGNVFSMPIPDKVRRNDKLYKIVSSKLVNDGQGAK